MTKYMIEKKLTYRAVLLVTFSLISLSCNKYLTLTPQDGLVRDEFWLNKEQVVGAVAGMYSSMLQAGPSTTGYTAPRPLAETFFIWGELRADNVVTNLNSSVDQVAMATGGILPTNALVQWSTIYKVINNCNTIIDFAPGVLAKDNTFTQAQLDGYLAEALTVRALMYFYLVKTFRDAPLKIKSTSSDADLVQLAKSTDTQILAQIKQDLDIAAKTAPFTYPTIELTKGHITRYGVWALQADVALWTEQYQDCIDACDKIINSAQFGLVAFADYTTLYYNGNSNESIFELQFNLQAPNSFFPILSSSKPVYIPGPNIVGAVDPTTGGTSSGGNYAFILDPVNDKNFDYRPNNDVNSAVTQITKYTAGRTVDASITHWIVYRYADVLLMKAEACAWVGSTNGNATRGQDALDLINQVRTRAHAVYTTLETPSVSDSEGISEYVLHERNREFIFEGKRWYDLLRNAKRDYPNHLNLITDAVATTVPAQYQQKLIAAFHDKNFLYLPVFYGEILSDPNLVQNPYYK